MEKVKIFAVVLFCWFLASCATTKPQVIVRDSVRIEYKERIVKEIDTAFIPIEKEVIKNVTRDTISHLETKYAESDAVISGGFLSHTLQNKNVQIQIPTEKEIVYRDSIVYKDRFVEKVVEVNKLTWFQKFKMKFFYLFCIVLGFYLLRWYFRRYY